MSVSYKNHNVGIAVIGCGNWGKNLIRAFHELGALRAICDIDTTKTAALSEKYQIPALSLDQILSHPDIVGVAIATPSVTHYDLGLRAIKADKHIYIEKPFSLEIEQAITLNHAALDQQRIAMVGHLLQYHPVFNKLKELARNGTLGEIQHVYSHRCNFGKFPPEKNVLWDFAPHDVSMVLALMNTMPGSISAHGANHLFHTELDSANIHLTFPAGGHAHIFVSWLHPYKEQKLIVIGNKAMAVFDDCQPWQDKLKLYSYPAEWTDGMPKPFINEGRAIHVNQSEPLLAECAHFITCINENSQPVTNGEEAIRVITVLEKALQTINEKKAFSTEIAPRMIPTSILSKQVDMISEEAMVIS